MRLTRIHAPARLNAGEQVSLPASATKHLVRVLRLGAGDELLVFDGNGHEHQATLIDTAGAQAAIKVGAPITNSTESNLHITLMQGISRAERMDWTLQKSTELGISAIAPVLTSRSVVRLNEQQTMKKQEHWQQVVISACEQSGRSTVPNVMKPSSLREHLAHHQGNALRLILNPRANKSLNDIPTPDGSIELLIGPEGGLDDSETELAQSAGFIAVKLGPRVLRTETAAMATLAAMQTLWGDFR